MSFGVGINDKTWTAIDPVGGQVFFQNTGRRPLVFVVAEVEPADLNVTNTFFIDHKDLVRVRRMRAGERVYIQSYDDESVIVQRGVLA